MTTTITTTATVMQGGFKGEGSKKQQGRLPVIAPKDDISSSASSSRSRGTSSGAASTPVPARTRLPPRSRTGCWTCRTRKVKCDEGRPICGQCSRLGHTCDYSPRLSFRDDTRRVVDRMQDVSIVASPVWDPSSPLSTDGGRNSVDLEDPLPPFAALTSDEDRERKAEAQSPGTFHVVVNQESFANHPEYNDDLVESPVTLARRGSIAYSSTSGFGRDMPTGEMMSTPDPHTVIMKRFEDFSRRSPNVSRESRMSESPVLLKPQPAITLGYDEQQRDGGPLHSSGSKTPKSPVPDAALAQHFRTKVWPQLAQFECVGGPGEQSHFPGVDLIEDIAAVFSPCFHALMALAATTLAHQNEEQRLDALQHHQQVLMALQTNLKSADDLTSDGTFLTHFLLLVYEIIAAESDGSTMWSQQLTQILRISLMRRDALGGERYPFIIWWICDLDLQALLSGSGSGEFVEAMLKDDMMPPPAFQLCPLGADGASIIYPEETDILPVVLQLNYKVTIIACRIGLLARELRNDTLDFSAFVTDLPSSMNQPIADARLRERRVNDLQDALRQLWTASNIIQLKDSVTMLQGRSRRVFEHAIVLYRACLIYSLTSMWPTQRLDTSAEHETEIELSVQEIVQIADGILNNADPRTGCRFIIFPLFMAGVASTNGADKMLALGMIQRMEADSIGPNTRKTRDLLQLIYERQTQRFMSTGQSLDMNWMAVISERDENVISFGL